MDLSITVNGIKFPNPFLLGSGPPGTNARVLAKSFDAGWGGAVATIVPARRAEDVVLPPLEVRDHRLDAGLLQHDLRDPHRVRVRAPPPRKVPLGPGEPPQQRLAQLVHSARSTTAKRDSIEGHLTTRPVS